MAALEAQESKEDKKMIVYNIENFVVNQMFRPYRSVIVEEKFKQNRSIRRLKKN